MGYNRVLLLYNDEIKRLEDNPASFFGSMNAAFRIKNPDKPANFPGGVAVIEHHTDSCSLIIAGGNYAAVLGQLDNYTKPVYVADNQIEILKQVLSRMGYSIRKKTKR